MGTRYGFAAVAGLLLLACTDIPAGPELAGTDESAAARPSPPSAADPVIAWSNDGLWVMNADGSNQARVTQRSGRPTWSPIVGPGPSYQLAYSGSPGYDTVWVIDISIASGTPKGSSPRVLATGASQPAWSPLGDEIAYLRPGPLGGAGIWVMNPAGTAHTPVYEPPASEGRTFMHPTWRGDGLALAFWEDRSPTSPGLKKIQVVTRASRADAWSTPTTMYLDPNPSAGNSLEWARTKNVLAFTDGTYGGTAVELLNLDSLSAGVDTVGTGLRPSWSPDDKFLVYLSGGVAKLELATGRVFTLAKKASCCNPSWRRTPLPTP